MYKCVHKSDKPLYTRWENPLLTYPYSLSIRHDHIKSERDPYGNSNTQLAKLLKNCIEHCLKIFSTLEKVAQVAYSKLSFSNYQVIYGSSN